MIPNWRKILIIFLIPLYCLILFEGFLLFAPAILSFLRNPRLWQKTGGFKIYAIGDSFTYGLGLTREEAYPALLEKKLPEITVINMGKPAHSLSTFYYEIKKLNETAQLKNSLILLQGGWNCNDNDFIRFQKQQSQEFFTRFKLFLNNLRTFRIFKSYYLYKKIYYPYGQEDYVPPFMGMMHYNFVHYQKITCRYLAKIAQYAQENQIKLVLLNYPQNPPPENELSDLEFYHYLFGRKAITEEDYLIKNPQGEIAVNRIIKFVSKKYEIPLIDLALAFKESEEENLFLEDYHHPNKKGARLMTETIYQKLRERSLLN